MNDKKHELMSEIDHLNLLLEVVPVSNPKYYTYSKELDLVIEELRQLIITDTIKNEERLMKLN